ncbi:carbohydrate ABC transporter permease [Alsobacter sp. SYSU M60028]|uniref:Carbohydrate ABC transporter permease n=1 Tax=Alsobacter ponti TaxID=2962936 RepID=A0ABT1LAV5_9HYPH|nr:carbohydrate ABC transporter permease [Alsobacter ponti]MCP8938559.1 carbohydrate ABC transporter permease [Alsobacter ponti]
MQRKPTFLGLPLTYRTMIWFLAVYALLIVAVVAILFPVFWMASSSLKPQSELFARNLTMLPVNWSLENYRNVWLGTDFPIYFVNSFKVAAITTALSVAISIYAAYAIARIRFPGRYAYGLLLLVTQMFPHILLVIPMFIIMQRMGLLNTHAALIIAYTSFSLPFTIWMLRGFFEAIPQELEEAAAIDGASQLTAFHKVILPLAGPGLAAVTMFGFIRSWNEFLFALVFMQSHDLFTLPIGLASFQEEYTFRWDLLMAGAGIVTLPVLFFFLLMQRFIVQGLLGGAVKG